MEQRVNRHVVARLADHGYGYGNATIHADVPSGTVAEAIETVERLGRDVLPVAAKLQPRRVV